MSNNMRKEQLFTKIDFEMRSRQRNIKDKIPMKKSKWLEHMSDCFNLKNPKGELMRCTLFSDGVIHSSRQRYLDSMCYITQDIQNDIILTHNEIVHNSEGFHCYFEVDFTDDNRLPTDDEIKQYVVTCQKITRECFPTADSHSAILLQNYAHIKQKPDGPKLALGLHIIFTQIYVRSETNLLVANLVDKRISAIYPIWSAATDLESYKHAQSNLRPIFSHKMIPCPTCSLKNDLEGKSKKRKKVSDTATTELPFIHQSLSLCNECHRGKIIDPNFYQVRWMIQDNEEIIEPKWSIEQQIRNTCLTTSLPQQFTSFYPPVDLGSTEDLRPTKLCHFPKDQQKFQNASKNTLNEHNHSESYLFITRLVRKMIAKVNPLFANIAIHKLKHRNEHTCKANILITLKGHGSRFCFIIGQEHSSNGVYFILNRQGRLYFACHNEECSLKLKTNQKYMTLNQEEKQECQRLFGFGGQTPVDGIHVPSKQPFQSFKPELQDNDLLQRALKEINE